jgi:quercetin dioxygenase-like cupin family protein
MSTTAVSPIALQAGEGESFWFLGALTTIKASGDTTDGRVAVVEVLAPQGHGSPLHVHRREDEWFYVMDGELAFLVGDERIEAPAGSFVYGPRDVPHTFAVTSSEARFLLVTEPAGFDAFVRAVGQPAPTFEIPPAAEPPADITPLVTAAAEHGIEILGPPGLPS